jgi:SAM-dependent methyltransferase
MANREMAELWNGPAGDAWVRAPERYDAMLADLGRLALDAAGLREGERVLDVGCGSGQLAFEAAERVGPGGQVVGVDVSAPLVALARRRAADAGLDRVRFAEGDVQEHDFTGEAYDSVLSRFGVMFFDDPVAAFANLRAATAPGGRLAFVAWQAAPLNEWVMTAVAALVPHVGVPDLPPPGAPGPFAFGDADHLRSLLVDSGWDDVRIEGVTTTLLVGGARTLDDAIAYYEQDLLGHLMLAKAEPAQRRAALAALREAASSRMSPEGLRLGAAVWLVTANRQA